MHGNLHIGETGFSFQFTFKDDTGAVLDLTGVPTTDRIRFQRPDKTTEDVDMVLAGDPTTGIATVAISDTAFLNQVGSWFVRGNAAGRLSDPATFQVDADLPEPV
jgi:hypothetical protein